MKSKLMWTFFMDLSAHTSDDWNSPLRYGWYPKQRYEENIKSSPEMWDKIVDYLEEKGFNTCVIDLSDGIKYDSYPDISAPDAWSKELMREKLAKMRANGIEPIPKLNFSMTHTAWMKYYRRYVSTPEYYKLASSLIAEICELFDNPRLFHLGMDEETTWDQTYREICIVRNEKLWWHDIHFLFDEVQSHGARPWIWADYFWHHPESFVKNVPKTVLLSNWFYSHIDTYTDYNKERVEAFEKLDKLGYEDIPCASLWAGITDNPYELMMHGKTKLSSELIKGYMIAPWAYEITERTELIIKYNAQVFSEARTEVYPESLN